MSKPKVEVYEKNVYGNTLIYPANDAANRFARIAGKRTLSKEHIQQIKLLGFEVHRVFEPRDTG